MTRPPVIDAHAHVFLDADGDPFRTVDDLAPAARTAPVEALLAAMDGAGVDRAVLVPLGPETEYVAQVRRTHPDRFRAIAVDDPTQPPKVVVERARRGGFDGLRLFGLPEEGRQRWEMLVAQLAAEDMVLWLYPGADHLAAVSDVAQALPGLRIALNHCGLTQAGISVDDAGRPRIEGALPQPSLPTVASLARHEQVVVILSGAYAFSRQPYPYADVATHVAAIAQSFSPARLMWASDFPWATKDPGYGALRDLVHHHLPALTPAERDDVLGGTCARFLQWRF